MNAIQDAITAIGSQSALAVAIGVTQPTISEWLKGKRPVPIERCTQVEQATNRAVMRWDLRPDDWHRIWPELIGLPDAPPVPAPQPAPQPTAQA